MKFTAFRAALSAGLVATATAQQCSVCGDGKVVTLPDVIFAFPAHPAVPCGQLEQAGFLGQIPVEQCDFLPPLIADVCGCKAIGNTPLSPPVMSPVPVPTKSPKQAVSQPAPSGGAALADGTCTCYGNGLLKSIPRSSVNEVRQEKENREALQIVQSRTRELTGMLGAAGNQGSCVCLVPCGDDDVSSSLCYLS
jgi:hypothetical protein